MKRFDHHEAIHALEMVIIQVADSEDHGLAQHIWSVLVQIEENYLSTSLAGASLRRIRDHVALLIAAHEKMNPLSPPAPP
ncbi:hypothetical protein [Lysobacter sp. P5_B9]